MYSSIQLINTVLEERFAARRRITRRRVEQLLYLTAAEYARLTERRLLQDLQLREDRDDFFIPTLRGKYHGDGQVIRRYSPDASGAVLVADTNNNPALKASVLAALIATENLPTGYIDQVLTGPSSAVAAARRHGELALDPSALSQDPSIKHLLAHS